MGEAPESGDNCAARIGLTAPTPGRCTADGGLDEEEGRDGKWGALEEGERPLFTAAPASAPARVAVAIEDGTEPPPPPPGTTGRERLGVRLEPRPSPLAEVERCRARALGPAAAAAEGPARVGGGGHPRSKPCGATATDADAVPRASAVRNARWPEFGLLPKHPAPTTPLDEAAEDHNPWRKLRAVWDPPRLRRPLPGDSEQLLPNRRARPMVLPWHEARGGGTAPAATAKGMAMPRERARGIVYISRAMA
mmetsp:Transcript_121115/g.302246  ORF Transcript_121115/g.302246 Transcript_121115/m.302246 type:complete len:251 (+) Transcript_121115:1473-2225(+)